MVTFVLVHGSYHGGWCWRKIVPALEGEGHPVFTPTLTGLGDRSHLVHPGVGLDLHVRDIVQVFDYEDLEDVVIVGHSYGGMVVTGVAEECDDRIDHLVYLDAYIPEDGQAAWDIHRGGEARWRERARTDGFGWLTPPPDPEETYDLASPDDINWLRERLQPTPILTHEQPVRIPENRPASLPRTFIACTRYDRFTDMARKARAEGLDYFELDTGHDAMVSAPEALSSILLDLPRRNGS